MSTESARVGERAQGAADRPRPYALIAEWDTPEDLIAAAHRTHEAGYRHVESYTPFPVHGLAEALHFQDNRVPWTIFLGGVAGAATGWFLQVYVSAIAYPLNVAGRPLIAWPSFVPVTFECTVLFAAFAALLGMLGYNGLPRPHHPIFDAQHFDRASQDRFFLAIEATDPRFDVVETASFLRGLGAAAVSEVENR